MGEGNKTALISMTNGDVYYVKSEDAKELIHYLNNDRGSLQIYPLKDVKSQAIVAVNRAHISSIVNRETDRG